MVPPEVYHNRLTGKGEVTLQKMRLQLLCLISCANTVTIKVTIATTKEGWQWRKPNLREGENKQMQDTNAQQLWVYEQNRHKGLSNPTATGYGSERAQGEHHWGDHPSCVLVLPAAHNQPASTASSSTSFLRGC